MRTRTALLLVLSLASAAAPAKDAATIQRLSDAFAAAFNRGDMAALAEMYTEDADLLPPDAGILKGRAAVRAFWAKAAEGVGDAKLTTVDVTPLGPDAAREIGTFTLKTKSPQPQELAGKYVVIWRKTGTDWKLATDIWNMGK